MQLRKTVMTIPHAQGSIFATIKRGAIEILITHSIFFEQLKARALRFFICLVHHLMCLKLIL